MGILAPLHLSNIPTMASPNWLDMQLGQVVRKTVNANPGLKVNRGNNFSSIKMLSTACVLCSLRLLITKPEGQKI